MPYADNNGFSLFYDDNEAGSNPLIFVPGFGGVGSFWKAQQKEFSTRNRVILVDHRGTGSSSKQQSEYSIEQMGQDVIAVMDHAGIAQATIVGHSTGGAIAQLIGTKWPTRVNKLVLSSTWCRPGNYFRRVFEFRRSLLVLGDLDGYHKAGIVFRYQPEFVETNDHLWEVSGPVDIDITIRRINAVLDSDQFDQSASLRQPTLIVATKDDLLVPKFLSDELASVIKGSNYIALESGGHFHPETRSNAFNNAIRSFV
ncbi:aminoacrylate hydrolase [Tardiphaga sp. OK246]|uniref:alpha/beta fold hydrolase n=1 Tax=Tardiphaga sp. OK246 TaxID=1855307 RepID=UPI000B6DA316|nr:alpha/beta fold hydrolase [Tardiphaga sp. OK246]SNT31874.1 aminoacrylate hydrolase [Tardiphaga sp. OK246]